MSAAGPGLARRKGGFRADCRQAGSYEFSGANFRLVRQTRSPKVPSPALPLPVTEGRDLYTSSFEGCDLAVPRSPKA
jgi:hypothetical protein